MENNINLNDVDKDISEALPTVRFVSPNEMAGSDNIQRNHFSSCEYQPSYFQHGIPSNDVHDDKNISEAPPTVRFASNEIAGFDNIQQNNFSSCRYQSSYFQHGTPSTEETSVGSVDDVPLFTNHGRNLSISVSVPTSPDHSRLRGTNVLFFNVGEDKINATDAPYAGGFMSPKWFYSQPIPKGSILRETSDGEDFSYHKGLKDKRFDSFKTFSGNLGHGLNLLGRQSRRSEPKIDDGEKTELDKKHLPVHRYFDALEGPELDKLRASEEAVLPQDKIWPFLLRFPISSFGICLGVSSQAILWKKLATTPSTEFLHVPPEINLVLWFISIALVVTVFTIYLLKVILYFEAVRREYYHPIRVNFFFAPWIAILFLALGVPPIFAKNIHHILWYIMMTPIFCLELKIYGQWMSGDQRRLSKVANPSNHLAIVGNFVGALLGASIGLKEAPFFFFAVGLAHYMVLFVTLYQRLPTNDTLPKELHPVFFLFVAAPSVASMAWAQIQGSFDYGSRLAYFIALFLYCSLAVRVNFFRGFKFSLAWWAYTFPMTGAAIATIRYSSEVTTVVTKALCVTLSFISTLTVTALLITTIMHAFVFQDLFPNDLAIAISDRMPKLHKRWFELGYGHNNRRDIENYLKFSSPNSSDDAHDKPSTNA